MNKEIATLAGGCFWCTEAIFKRLKGVISVTPGYSGGSVANPTYSQVTSGKTGHAEAVQIEFDPEEISYDKVLDVFWHIHNPTELNRQGFDIGSEYRSLIFYHNDKQKIVAQKTKSDLEKSGIYKDKIVTEIIPFVSFYPAEDYHKDYFDNNVNAPYCEIIISPKVHKLLKEYSQDVRNEYKEKPPEEN